MWKCWVVDIHVLWRFFEATACVRVNKTCPSTAIIGNTIPVPYHIIKPLQFKIGHHYFKRIIMTCYQISSPDEGHQGYIPHCALLVCNKLVGYPFFTDYNSSIFCICRNFVISFWCYDCPITDTASCCSNGLGNTISYELYKTEIHDMVNTAIPHHLTVRFAQQMLKKVSVWRPVWCLPASLYLSLLS